jgi:hypothetical protein
LFRLSTFFLAMTWKVEDGGPPTAMMGEAKAGL